MSGKQLVQGCNAMTWVEVVTRQTLYLLSHGAPVQLNCAQAAWRLHILCSIRVHSFGALAKASLHNQPMCPKMCSTDIFIDLQPVSWNLKGDFLTLVLEVGGTWASGISPFDSSSMGSYSSPLTLYGLSITVFELLSWLQRRFHHPGYDDNYHSTMQ